MTALPSAAFILADVHLLTPDEGGRRTGIMSGYRCNCWIGFVGESGERTYNDATLYLVDVGELSPGSTARARIQPHYLAAWSHLSVGARLELCEGRRVVGDAVVVDLISPPAS